jgi:hypothetical protein
VAKEPFEDGGGAFVAETLTTFAINMSTNKNRVAARAKPRSKDNFRVPFVMADPSSSTTLYEYGREHETAEKCNEN